MTTRIIYYDDHYCLFTGKKCERGSVSLCPEKKNNLEVVCKFFIHKDNIQKEDGHNEMVV